jgi:dihydrofolate synthase / folylpolyglutamate synthase
MSLTSPLSDPEALLAPRLEQRIVPGLDRVHHALRELGHPERSFASVVIVGTNGKGSTAALLDGALRGHRVRTGLYTSPHLLRVEERIRIDDRTISSHRLGIQLHRLEAFPELSYFEALTAAALMEFAEAGVELAILEAGLGGRWDAVNAVEPVVTLLTNVGTDHQEWLGADRTSIAAEKAAALRGLTAIVGEWDDEVEPVIRAVAPAAAGVSTTATWASAHEVGNGNVAVAVDGASTTVELPLLGPHQLSNLRLALAGLAALVHHAIAPPLDIACLRRGIAATRWPGRLQWMMAGGRRVLLDGAHNHEAAIALAEALRRLGLAGRLHLVFSCLDDKPVATMAGVLQPLARSVTVTGLPSPRRMDPQAIAAAFSGCRIAADARTALASLPAREPALVTGSLRLVGEVLGWRDTDG